MYITVILRPNQKCSPIFTDAVDINMNAHFKWMSRWKHKMCIHVFLFKMTACIKHLSCDCIVSFEAIQSPFDVLTAQHFEVTHQKICSLQYNFWTNRLEFRIIKIIFTFLHKGKKKRERIRFEFNTVVAITHLKYTNIHNNSATKKKCANLRLRVTSLKKNTALCQNWVSFFRIIRIFQQHIAYSVKKNINHVSIMRRMFWRMLYFEKPKTNCNSMLINLTRTSRVFPAINLSKKCLTHLSLFGRLFLSVLLHMLPAHLGKGPSGNMRRNKNKLWF